MNIPFVDLRAQHDELREQIEAAFSAALDDSGFIGGSRVTGFEQAFAQFCRAKRAVAVASGTDALELSLRAVGVGSGDIVVTVANTFMATAEAAIQLGAAPRFIDIDPLTYNIDPTLFQAYLTEHCAPDPVGVLRERASGLRVAAVIPVHLYGLPADMAPILELAQRYGIEVIEDACQAHGAEYRMPDSRWVRVGTLSRAGCFSFYPGKNLGALGEAGAVTTNDTDIANRVSVYRDHGQSERYIHVSPDGVNGRMDAIQAAILHIKLDRLEEWNAWRRRAAGWYAEELQSTGLQLPVEPEGMRHVYHLYVVRVPNRDRVREELGRSGVATGLHYPIPLHLQPALAQLELGPGSFPEAEKAATEIVSLPMYPHITREQVTYVADQLRRALR